MFHSVFCFMLCSIFIPCFILHSVLCSILYFVLNFVSDSFIYSVAWTILVSILYSVVGTYYVKAGFYPVYHFVIFYPKSHYVFYRVFVMYFNIWIHRLLYTIAGPMFRRFFVVRNVNSGQLLA